MSTLLIMLTVMTWPLLLIAGITVAATRSVALRLVPWAALPAALLLGITGDVQLRIPTLILGAGLVLDDVTRTFLLLTISLWLASGLLARPRLHRQGACRFAVLYLLALTGALGLVFAGDALLFFTASTLVTYALYGLLAHDVYSSARTAGRVFIGLMVTSDVLVFELLVLLGQSAQSVTFDSLRQAVLDNPEVGVIGSLVLLGFGIKAAVLGVHLWFISAIKYAPVTLRPILVSFLLCAGVLAWLRVWPLGEQAWRGLGDLLIGLSWLSAAYVLLAGLRQTAQHGVLAHAAVALTGLVAAVLGVVMQQPSLWDALAQPLRVTLLYAGLLLAGLLILVPSRPPSSSPGFSPVAGLRWLIAALLAFSPAALLGQAMVLDAIAQLMTVTLGFIAFRALWLAGNGTVTVSPPQDDPHDGRDLRSAPGWRRFYIGVGLLVVAAWAIAPRVVAQPMAGFAPTTLLLVMTLLLARLSVFAPLLRLRRRQLSWGSLLGQSPMGVLLGCWTAVRQYLSHWSRTVSSCWGGVTHYFITGSFVRRLESGLSQWGTAVALVILLALLTAGLAARG